MRRALQRNLTQLHGQAATLARDSDSGKLWLFRTGDANQLTTATIGEFFEQFVNAADQWSRFDAGSSGVAFPAAGFPFPMLRP